MLDDFNHIFVLINPASTGIRQATLRIKELKALFPERKIEFLEMVPGGREANRLLLHGAKTALGPKTLLCIAAGDGSTSLLVEKLMQDIDLTNKARLTPILPLWGGNANDLANMLNGPASRAQLKSIFEYGQVIPIHPLHFQITERNRAPLTHIAVCNTSFGASAYVAQKLNESSYRQSLLHKVPGGRLLKETATAMGSLLKVSTFAAEEAGKRKIIYERTISNGSRFAKLYQMPVQLNDKRFYLHTVEGKQFLITALRLGARLKRPVSETDLYKSITFIVREPTLAQFDGEILKVAAGTKVAVNVSKQPFYAISTLLKHS